MAKVDDAVPVPQPLVAFRARSADVFCRKVFPDSVSHWPSWIKFESQSAKIQALVDGAEAITVGSSPATGKRVRLTKGGDVFEVEWDESWTEVFLGTHGAAIFDVYATIHAVWNRQPVLSVRMGGNASTYEHRWFVIAIEKYEVGAWLDLVDRICKGPE